MTNTLRAFHLAFLEALDLSRKNGCHEVTLYQQGGEYGSVYAQHGPPGSVTVCHLRAGYRTVGQVERGEVATSRPRLACKNCGGEPHADHADLCCLCFTIGFGKADHDAEHAEAHRSDTPEHAAAIEQERVAVVGSIGKEGANASA